MSNLTYLNDASVLHNLKQRYYTKLIYVSCRIWWDWTETKKKHSITVSVSCFLCAMILILVLHPFSQKPEPQFGPENTTNDHNYTIYFKFIICQILLNSITKSKIHKYILTLTHPPFEKNPVSCRLDDIVRQKKHIIDDNLCPIFHYLLIFFLFIWIVIF